MKRNAPTNRECDDQNDENKQLRAIETLMGTNGDVVQTTNAPDALTFPRLNGALEKCMRYMAEQYRGGTNLAMLEPIEAYYKMTRNSPEFAVVSKNALFIEPHKLAYARNVDLAWRDALAKMVPWWRDSDPAAYAADNQRVAAALLVSGMSVEGNTVTRIGSASNRGTFIHERYGEELMRRVFRMFIETGQARSDARYTHSIPGRMVNHRMGLCAATPDGITTRRADMFLPFVGAAWRKSVQGGPRVYEALVIDGAPRVVYEFKTMQTAASMVSPDFVVELTDLFRAGAVDEVRKRAIDEILARNIAGKWTVSADPADVALSRRVQRIKRGATTPKYFWRTCGLYPSNVLSEYATEFVTGDVYKHLAEPDPICGASADGSSAKKRRPARKDEAPTASANGEPAFENSDMYNLKRHLNNVGCAIVIGYECRPGYENQYSFHTVYDRAPLQLSPASAHYAQMCAQAGATFAYNEKQRYVYVSVLSAAQPPSQERHDAAINIALVYAYDTGIGRDDYVGFVRRAIHQLRKSTAAFKTIFDGDNAALYAREYGVALDATRNEAMCAPGENYYETGADSE